MQASHFGRARIIHGGPPADKKETSENRDQQRRHGDDFYHWHHSSRCFRERPEQGHCVASFGRLLFGRNPSRIPPLLPTNLSPCWCRNDRTGWLRRWVIPLASKVAASQRCRCFMNIVCTTCVVISVRVSSSIIIQEASEKQ